MKRKPMIQGSEFVLAMSSRCLYGNQDRRDRVLFEFHFFSLIVTVTLAFLLVGSTKLKRIYSPLASVVTLSLIFQLTSDVLFFSSYPYSETEGNCTETLVHRLYIILIMFGELHQVYFMANLLGLRNHRFEFRYLSLSLEQFLRLAALLAGASILASAVFERKLFMVSHSMWALFVVSLQLYFIAKARKFQARALINDALIDVNNDAVNIFERLSWLQIIPTCVALTDRILELDGIFIASSLDGVMLILECLSNYLFYIKILVLQEKANTINVEVL